jgi:hypothetical protein
MNPNYISFGENVEEHLMRLTDVTLECRGDEEWTQKCDEVYIAAEVDEDNESEKVFPDTFQIKKTVFQVLEPSDNCYADPRSLLYVSGKDPNMKIFHSSEESEPRCLRKRAWVITPIVKINTQQKLKKLKY